MNELVKVVERLQAIVASAEAQDPAIAVATVVNTRGPAYRRPGARLIVRRSGKVEGSISAGCLEKDVVAHCEHLATEPVLLTYDGNSPEDLLFGLKLGCEGLIQVLLEPLTAASPYLDQSLLGYLKSHKRVAAVTIFHSDQESRLPQGLSLCLTTGLCQADDHTNDQCAQPAAHFLPSFSGQSQCCSFGELPALVDARVRREAEHAIAQRKNIVLHSSACGTIYNALLEVVEQAPALIIFGSGPDARVLAELAVKIGWTVTISDYAARLKLLLDLPETVKTIDIESQHLCTRLSAREYSCSIVMSHDVDCDKLALNRLLSNDETVLAYTGVIGPARRTERLLSELAAEGRSLDAEHIARLHSPAGLDIGAESAEEVALSVLCEIKAVLSHSQAGFLRDKRAPIHTPLEHVVDVPDALNMTPKNAKPASCELAEPATV